MAWIAKRPVKLERDGETITVTPGSPVPEAKDFKNPTLWCVWAEDKAEVVIPKEAVTIVTEGDESLVDESQDDGSEDYQMMTLTKLKPLANAVFESRKDTSSNVNKMKKDELIAVIKAGV